MSRILLALIRFYQRYFSPFLGAHCQFEPSCSRYTAEAIEVHGSVKGSLLGAWRILRCNPLSRAGQIDPVPRRGEWRAPDSLHPPDTN